MAKTRVFIDTNIIIEAFRTGCWTAICNKFDIVTVDKCVEEALTGNPDDPGHVHIDRDALLEGLAGRHQVGKLELANLVLSHPSCHGLDDGELHLLAWLHAQGLLPNALILVSTADKAAIVATGNIGWLDSLTSLEHLANESGVTHGQINALARHYRAGWLDEIRIKIRLGVIP
ncbi:MAG: hypothetical protein K1562_03310 [Candidatus Thiodiazotropha sp. (ex. Lucinisca nassula)]|nr:hypothetical protein [Candidatus Thiodiazotropha taylori]MBW9256634.1 hypothetical protein [Candidatus Thiodiazotropha sp. (ex. Lucinisca nassula)]